jgi:hypothetical protein
MIGARDQQDKQTYKIKALLHCLFFVNERLYPNRCNKNSDLTYIYKTNRLKTKLFPYVNLSNYDKFNRP